MAQSISKISAFASLCIGWHSVGVEGDVEDEPVGPRSIREAYHLDAVSKGEGAGQGLAGEGKNRLIARLVVSSSACQIFAVPLPQRQSAPLRVLQQVVPTVLLPLGRLGDVESGLDEEGGTRGGRSGRAGHGFGKGRGVDDAAVLLGAPCHCQDEQGDEQVRSCHVQWDDINEVQIAAEQAELAGPARRGGVALHQAQDAQHPGPTRQAAEALRRRERPLRPEGLRTLRLPPQGRERPARQRQRPRGRREQLVLPRRQAREVAAQGHGTRGQGNRGDMQERKEGDKKLQGALESYLIELTGFKGKAGSSCAASIRQLRELEKDVESLEREAKRQAQLSRDIYRKVHSQFSSQIEDIGCSLAEEERQRLESEEQVLTSIERMYHTLSGALGEGRRGRERQEREVVELLERVIEKLRRQMASE